MIRSSVSAFVVVCLCFAIMQIPGRPESVAIPTAEAFPPNWEMVAMPQASSCPGGVCPLPQRAAITRAQAPVVYPQITAPTPVIRSANHWTYPGDIDSHMADGHGVNTAGMTREQAETLHDQLHEGTAGTSQRVQSYAYTRSTYQTSSRPVRSFVGRPLARIVQARPVRGFVRRVFCR